MIFSSRTNNRGIALLMAIIVSAIVLALGLSISIITSRSIILSGGVRESQLAYYAAEAGSECVRYWSLQDRRNFSSTQGFTISCNDEDFTWPLDSAGPYNFQFGHNYYIGVTEFAYPYISVVSVMRKAGLFNLDIDAKGYNTDVPNASRKFERTQDLNAYGICSYRPDIMFVLDLSSSVSADDLNFIKSSLTQFVNTLNPTDTGVHIGIVQFGSRADMALHLTGDKAEILLAVENLFRYGVFEDYTNLAAGIQFARAELGNQQMPIENWLYCPLGGGPDRVVVQFPHRVKTSIGINDNLGGGGPLLAATGDLPEIPEGNYNIYVATCDGWGTSGKSIWAGRIGQDSPLERARLNLFDNSGLSGAPFFSSDLTDDVPDPVSYGQAVTLVNQNQYISQTARGFQMEHCTVANDNPDNCPVTSSQSFLALCVAFETVDGSPLSTSAPNNYNYTTQYDRPDNESPDYIIVVTDGGSTQYYSCIREDANGDNLFTDADHTPGVSDAERNLAPYDVNLNHSPPDPIADIWAANRRRNALTKAVVEADAARSIGIDIFAIGIDIADEDCPGFTNCTEHLNEAIASFAVPDYPDVDGNAFYFDAEDYDDLDDVLSQIINCVHPLSE
ncbi:MAG: VWA domain-containing protein [Candidatus Pacebacteria bacterium]|nr:VWA domain-containing protein [Candidatus Paceibacterota bacterium]